ncbi:hypothetical protein LIER_35250 [Lithospermum erythrorhizon]|uniref:Reverse transcriptase domain-containing protein n=1 Tax=Lithospermum erythrorhizon TaxID=34254 RepID=A0AAV3NNL4_LITER
MSDFSQCLQDCNLLNAGFVVSKFTWTNGKLSQCLDRVVCDKLCLDTFPVLNVRHLAKTASDHAPLLIELKLLHDTPKDNMARPSMADLVDCIPNLVSAQDNEDLMVKPSMDEVRNIFFSMDKNSMAGSDGFNRVFYQSFWDFVGVEVLNVVCFFMEGANMPRGLTSTVLTLLPKYYGPRTWNQYRPISLCTFASKVITKLINNRLSAILPKITSEFQTGVFALGLAKLQKEHPQIAYNAGGSVQVPCLAFADDCLLFCNGLKSSLDKVNGFLAHFQSVSGQVINKDKSSCILSDKLPSNRVHIILKADGFKRKTLPFQYLGIPIFKGKRQCFLFDSLLDLYWIASGLLSIRGSIEIFLMVVALLRFNRSSHLFRSTSSKSYTCRIRHEILLLHWFSGDKDATLWKLSNNGIFSFKIAFKEVYTPRSKPPTVVVWSRPDIGKYKLNIDGSFKNGETGGDRLYDACQYGPASADSLPLEQYYHFYIWREQNMVADALAKLSLKERAHYIWRPDVAPDWIRALFKLKL